MKYPKLNNFVSFEINESVILAKNHLTEDSILLSRAEYELCKSLDGKTNPYSLIGKKDYRYVKRFLKYLNNNYFINERHFLSLGLGTVLFPIASLKNLNLSTSNFPVWAYLYNFVLLILWLPIFLLGMFLLFYNGVGNFNNGQLLAGCLFGLIIGIIFHELSHALSAIGYNAKVFEIGVMIKYFVIPCAYVLIDNNSIKRKLRKAQVDAAGIEMNFFLSGIAMTMTAMAQNLSGFFFTFALVNLLMGLVNLTIVDGFDGEHVFCDIMGDSELFQKAKCLITDKIFRNQVMKKGINGRATIVASAFLMLFKIAMPILIINEIVGLFLWIK